MFFLEDLPDQRTLQAFAKRFPEMRIDSTAACLRLLRVASHLFRHLEEHFATHQLSLARFLVLIVLERTTHKQLMPVEIARQLGVSKKNTSRLLAYMETDKLVSRTSHQTDGRASVISIEPKGANLLNSALPGYYGIFNRTMKQLDARKKNTLIQILDKVATQSQDEDGA
jgi:DNA-binding MarR family transcriptional regulator